MLNMGWVRYGLCLASPEGIVFLTSGARLSAVKVTCKLKIKEIISYFLENE